ncbi:MAG: 4a-hydroxytetrahydrobiopterin dehydratase [Candidatus Spechtbacterales bacterium]
MAEKLNLDEIKNLKNNLPDSWKIKKGKELEAEFKFPDFRTAMVFVNKISQLAENINHHPDICISYNKVQLKLTTHSTGGLTEKDFELAKEISLLYF